MNRTFISTLIITAFFFGCSSSSSKKPPRVPEPETLKTIRDVKPGLGDQCISFDRKYIIDATDENGNRVLEEVNMFDLRVENGVQKYYFAEDLNEERITVQDIIASVEIQGSLTGNIREIIKAFVMDYVRRNTNKIIDFMIGGIDASGNIVDKSFEFTYPGFSFLPDLDYTFPIKYSVDCFDNVTSMHLLIDDFAVRMVYRLNDDQTISIDVRTINEVGDRIEREQGLLIPLDDSRVSSLPIESPNSSEISFFDSKALELNVNLQPSENLSASQKIFFALYNSEENSFLALAPHIDFTEEDENFENLPLSIRLSSLLEYETLIQEGYSLVVSSTYLKDPLPVWDDYYFPLEDNETLITDPEVQVLISAEDLNSCIANDSCEELTSGISEEIQIFSPSTEEGGNTSFTFTARLIETIELSESSTLCSDTAASCTVYDSNE